MNKQKILIVDDDANIAELIALYLTKECFDTRMVHDGEMALEVFDNYQPLTAIRSAARSVQNQTLRSSCSLPKAKSLTRY